VELVAMLRLLWSWRIVAGLGVVVAVAAGVLAGSKAEARTAAGSATVSGFALMLDTEESQLVAAAPDGAWTLPTRAFLLADAIAGDTATATIARDAGVAEAELAVLGPSARKVPSVDSPLVSKVYAVTSSSAAPYVVNVLADNMTPIIKVEASAPDTAGTERLARAVEGALRDMLVRHDADHKHGFVLDAVTPLRTKKLPAPSSHARLLTVAAALMTFVLWCAGVVLAAGLARRLRGHAQSPRPA
jgi:hypothetical protein